MLRSRPRQRARTPADFRAGARPAALWRGCTLGSTCAFLKSDQAYSLAGSARHHPRSRVAGPVVVDAHAATRGDLNTMPIPFRVCQTPSSRPAGKEQVRGAHVATSGNSKSIPIPFRVCRSPSSRPAGREQVRRAHAPRSAAYIPCPFPPGFPGRRHCGQQGESRCAVTMQRGALSQARPGRLARRGSAPGVRIDRSAGSGARGSPTGLPNRRVHPSGAPGESRAPTAPQRSAAGAWEIPCAPCRGGAAPAALYPLGAPLVAGAPAGDAWTFGSI